MPHIDANGVNLYYERVGPETGPETRNEVGKTVLLIHGLATPMNAWPKAMVAMLVDSGFNVIRFDNRDVGLSEKMSDLGKANIPLMMVGYKFGFKLIPPYTIQDMADDALALLDALNIESAAVVGASMGGMIAQRIAACAPERVASLCSIMSSSGAPGLPPARKHVLDLLYSSPSPHKRGESLEHSYMFWRAIGSKTYPEPEGKLRQFLADLADWGTPSANGGSRHFAAIYADRERYKALASIKVPTLVIHGLEDTLVPPACGQDTASRIKDARFMAVEGMGHDFPALLIAPITQAVIRHIQRGSSAPKTLKKTLELVL